MIPSVHQENTKVFTALLVPVEKYDSEVWNFDLRREVEHSTRLKFQRSSRTPCSFLSSGSEQEHHQQRRSQKKGIHKSGFKTLPPVATTRVALSQTFKHIHYITAIKGIKLIGLHKQNLQFFPPHVFSLLFNSAKENENKVKLSVCICSLTTAA